MEILLENNKRKTVKTPITPIEIDKYRKYLCKLVIDP